MSLTAAALTCLALNLYHEARGEPLEGQVAVVLVVRNRAGGDPKRVCAEVYREAQFSWTLRRDLPRPKPAVLARLRDIAAAAWRLRDYTRGATHYHALRVFPDWAQVKQPVGVWGQHIFYRSRELPRAGRV